ncbi:myb-like protein AA isoform X1 [Mytilus trossulus]|uniref:myb-like protein AA isoform X1 n=1 Tax=Mytilus trossulus TaxID=6551 RepID=UPI0030051A56
MANIKIEPLPMDRYSPLTINVNAMDDDKVQKQLLKRQRESKSDKFHLMEYRQAPVSPGASSVHSQDDMDNADILASPPVSPPPVKQDMDDDRLPNELLEEICEDIGMKEGMELDFVEFLMEQDMVDPHMYMTPEAIKNTLANVSSAPVPSSVTFAIPSNKTTFSAEITNNRSKTCGSPTTTYSQASSTNGTVATSSGSSSPVAKRFHVSTSGPPSPVRTKPPIDVFKAPPTPPTPRRPSSNSQSIASPSISSTQGPFSPQPSTSTPQKQPPPYSQATSQQQVAQKCMQRGNQSSSGAYNYQRLGRPAPPNVNVQNMHQQWPGKMQQNHVPQQPNQMNQACALNGNMRFPPQTQQYSRHRESPMDNGYFSADTGSVRSYGSSVQSSASASSSMTAIHRSASLPDQKSVHFAGDCERPVLQQQHSTEALGGYNPYDTNIPDCDLIENQRNLPSKILPRLSSSMKPDIAPYNLNYPRGSNSRPGSGDNPMASAQTFEYPHSKAGDIFDVDNNQNNMFINNYNSSMQNHPMQEPDFSSCSGGAPMGMQPLRHFNEQNSCNMQQMNAQQQMYGSMQRNKGYKQNEMGNMNFCDNQYGHQGQNMNNSCSMMNTGPKMMGNPHGTPQGGMMGQNCNSGFQDEDFNQHHMSQQMHMNGQQPQIMRQGNMGNEFDQPQYNRMQGANMNSGMFPSETQQSNSAQNLCQPNWGGSAPQTPQPQPGMNPKGSHPGMSGMPVPDMQSHGQNPMQGGGPPMPCTIPNCQSCKTGSPHRPPMLSSQQSFIQHLITDRSSAFRSHPLFPLLRDLIIADMNFASPHFPYQLISNLPADFDKLLQNFLHRNPPNGQYQNNYAVESVIMDALKYAHHCLIEKIRSRQEQDKHTKSTSKSLSAIEEFCEKFDRSVRNSVIKPATFQVPNSQNQVTTTMGGPMGPGMTPQMETPTKDHKYSAMDNMMMVGGMFASPMAKKNLEMSAFSGQFKSLKDLADFSDNGSLVSSSSNHSNKSESKKHPSLPKEAVAIMLDWLRQHKDNPYPNDDEKAMLIKQTGLTINQINYWFTNARRRILPKWAQQCK